MVEIWKFVKGYQGLYMLRNDGLLYSFPRATTKGGYTYGKEEGHGYLHFTLTKNGVKKTIRMNRLVYETFVGPIPEGYDVHHINHNPKDNSVENLCLMESSMHNTMHNRETANKKSKTVFQYTTEGEFVAEYKNAYEATRQTKISHCNISMCCNGKRKTAGGYIWEYC